MSSAGRIVVLAAVAGAVVASGCIGAWRAERDVRATIARGDHIRMAVAQYVRDGGEPPRSLHALVPRYLRSIPEPAYGSGQWRYSPASSVMAADDGGIALRLPGVAREGAAAFSLVVPMHSGYVEGLTFDERAQCWHLPRQTRCWR